MASENFWESWCWRDFRVYLECFLLVPEVVIVMAEGGTSPSSTAECSASQESLMEKFMEMMLTMERNRLASEEKFLKLLERSNDREQENRECHAIPDFSKSIEDFSGETLGKPAMDWLSSLESAAVLHNWPQEYTLETAKIHMVSTARKWFTERASQIKTFEDFKASFKKTFDFKMGKDEMWEKMKKRIQGKTESIYSYFQDKVTLCKSLGFDFDEIKEQVIVGLQNKSIIPGLLAKDTRDTDQLLHEIVRFEKINNKANFYTHNKSQSRNFWNKNKISSGESDNVKVTTEITCMEADHDNLTRGNQEIDKKSRMICFKCKERGHFKKNCPQNTNQLPTTAKVLNGESASHSHTQSLVCSKNSEVDSIQKFIRPVKINHFLDITGFVDPGSAVCTIKESVIRANNLPYESTDQDLFGFGGQSIKSKEITKFIVTLDEVEEEVEALIVPDSSQPMDLVIGRTFTELPWVAYVKIGEQLHFGYKHEDPFRTMKWRDAQHKTNVFIQNDVKLKKNTLNFVDVQVGQEVGRMAVMTNQDVSLKVGDRLGEIRGDDETFVDYTSSTEDKRVPITLDMLNFDEDVCQEDRERLLNLIKEFRGCFALNLTELGCTDLMTVSIKDNDKPIKAKPYRCNLENRKTMKETVDEWRECGIVRDTSSSYSSPAFLVPKATGEKRLVVDFRRLNAQTERKTFPIPHIDDCFELLTGSKIFCTLDLMSGYLQIPLDEESKAKTAFIYPDGTAEFERMCFGLVNAPFEFSKLMCLALGPLRNTVAVSYLDDILIGAGNWAEMLDKLRQVFSAILKAKLTFKLSKCEFGRKSVKFLGFQLTADGIVPGRRKMTAVSEFPTPQNKHDVRRFLGLTGFFRRFIRDYAVITRPLTDLTRGNANFSWQQEHQKAFDDLKDLLQKAPILQLYNPKAKTELHCDASSLGIAGMLLQEGTDKKMHLIYCVSKKTSDVERMYHSSKLELLAIVWCAERLRPMLLGLKFTVVSDCQALVYLNAKKTILPQIARWYTTLAEYDFEIRHRAGDKMSHVDSLSRAPVEEQAKQGMIEEVYENRINIFMIINEEDRVLMIQKNDEKLKKIVEILQKDDKSNEEKNMIKNYTIENGRLYKEVKVNGENKLLYVIPDSMRKATVVKYHDLMGHWALDRTVSAILRKFWFKGMRRYVRKHIQGCFECLFAKVPGGKKAGMLHPPKIPERPMIKIHVDHLGPFPKSTTGKMYVLVIVCAFSRFVRLFAQRTTRSDETIRHMEFFIDQYGAAKVLVSDRGSAFMSTEFSDFCKKFDIEHKLIAAQFPQANGMAENRMKSIVPCIVTSINFEDERWDKTLSSVERKLNGAVNKTTGFTPFECLYGFQPNFEDAGLVNFAEREPEETRHEEIREKVKENTRRKQKKYKMYYDKRRYEGVKFNIGDIIAVRKPHVSTGQPTKTQLKYRGPFVVIELLPGNTYKLEKLNKEDGGSNITTVSHVSQMKIYRNSGESDDSGNDDSEDDEEVDFEIVDISEHRDEESDEDSDDSDEEWKPDSDGNINDTLEVDDSIRQNTRTKRLVKKPRRFDDYV